MRMSSQKRAAIFTYYILHTELDESFLKLNSEQVKVINRILPVNIHSGFSMVYQVLLNCSIQLLDKRSRTVLDGCVLVWPVFSFGWLSQVDDVCRSYFIILLLDSLKGHYYC